MSGASPRPGLQPFCNPNARAVSAVWAAKGLGTAPMNEAAVEEQVLQPQFAIVQDLQVQGLLYPAAEQFSTLVVAAGAHEPGTNTFEGRAAKR